MDQEVRVKLDVSITINAKHSTADLAAMIERGVRKAFPNNHKHFHSLRFAEEAALYSGSKRIRWRHIFRRERNDITPPILIP